jgi:hypothetical protein
MAGQEADLQGFDWMSTSPPKLPDILETMSDVVLAFGRKESANANII